jgi:hypothetical protein
MGNVSSRMRLARAARSWSFIFMKSLLAKLARQSSRAHPSRATRRGGSAMWQQFRQNVLCLRTDRDAPSWLARQRLPSVGRNSSLRYSSRPTTGRESVAETRSHRRSAKLDVDPEECTNQEIPYGNVLSSTVKATSGRSSRQMRRHQPNSTVPIGMPVDVDVIEPITAARPIRSATNPHC